MWHQLGEALMEKNFDAIDARPDMWSKLNYCLFLIWRGVEPSPSREIYNLQQSPIEMINNLI